MLEDKQELISVAVAGATGRMAKEVVHAASLPSTNDLRLSAVLHRVGSDVIGEDSGLLSGGDENHVLVSEFPGSASEAADYSVLIDFTQPSASMEYLEYCQEQDVGMVIGTTGFDSQQLQKINIAAASIPVLLAPNTAIGVNLCFALLKHAAAAIGHQADIEIIETHHRNKVDAPSGTALKMGEVIAEQLERNLEETAIYGREGNTGVRSHDTIGFSSIRAGDVIGEHTVVFALDGERIEISHKASTRAIYARGALRAAAWLSGQSPGLYTMDDVLGLSLY
jgi:4-hydroxy-tetrahydrodipicolinate reductase